MSAGLVCSLFLLLASVASAAPKIGVLVRDKAGFWTLAGEGASAAGKKAGADVIVRLPVIAESPAAQAKMLDALIAEKVDALVIAAVNPEILKPQLEAAKAKGIPVVAAGVRIAPPLAQSYVGLDQDGMTQGAASVLGGITADSDELLVLRVNTAETNVVDREKNLMRLVKEKHPGLTVHGDVYGNAADSTEVNQLRKGLQKYAKTTAVFTPNTAGTLAAIEVLTGANAPKFKIVGFGLYPNDQQLQLIRDGKVQGWVLQAPREIGRLAVETALALLEKKSVPETVLAPSAVLTRDNLDDAKVKALLAN